MKVKAIAGIETAQHTTEEDESGDIVLRKKILIIKEGDIVDLDDKLAQRLIRHGLVSEDLSAETNLERARREAAPE